MQTTLENLGQLERRLNVAVPVAQIEGEVQKRLAKLAKTVKLAGFRPGKVPLKMVAQQYGPQVRSDVIADAVNANFNDAVREQRLRVAGYPRIVPRENAEPAPDALEFSAVFEVYPDVPAPDVSGIGINRPRVEISAVDVDRTLEVLRKQRAKFVPVTRGAQVGDRVTVDFTGTIEGVAFPGGQARGFPVNLGENRMLPEFETAITGMGPGETRTFPLTFPADYHGKEVAGKSAEFTLTVNEIAEPHVPPLDEAFARAFGIASGNVADLRAEVEANLKLELKRKIDTVLKDQALSGLRAQAQFALPKSLVDIEARGLAARSAENMKQHGAKPEQINLDPDMFRRQAEDRVALGLIVGEMVRREGLQAKPEQVRALVQETAQTYEQPEAVVRWHYEKRERLADFEALAVEKNVVDWVMARARVTETPTSFEAIMMPSGG
jgi:trigger factor